MVGTGAGKREAERAVADARAAAHRAGVDIRTLHTPEEVGQGPTLMMQVWRSGDSSPVDAGLLRALAHTGNYVAGAFDAGEVPDPRQPATSLVGLSVAFLARHPAPGLHSHITCAAPDRQDSGLGFALKLHQRAWALTAGLTSITWTVDPLVRRNAYFNFVKLGASAADYLPDFYGPMTDGVNAGDESDRLLMSWDLTAALPEAGQRIAAGAAPANAFGSALGDEAVDVVGCRALTVGSDDEPQRSTLDDDASRTAIALQVPVDIVTMRDRDPDKALRWRRALREAMLDATSGGYDVRGFSRSGCYVLKRDSLSSSTTSP